MKPKAPIPPPHLIVVMGISGSGKSTIATALAHHLHCRFQEGDDLHPAANRAKMAQGEPLTDADRAPWLKAVGAWLADQAAAGECGVITCSALKRAYRDQLRAAAPGLSFIFPDPPESLLHQRLAHRGGHYMPASLLASQLATLERPTRQEPVLHMAGDEDTETAIHIITHWLDS